MTNQVSVSPFHDGETAVQRKLGVHDKVMSYAPRFVRNYLPDQHRAFYAGLPMLLVGSVDERGRPWASALFGRPGFVSSPDPQSLRIKARPVHGDPLNHTLAVGAPLGFLGLAFHSRRRNRLNGKVARLAEGGFEVAVDQAFGNCPQYIQAREFATPPAVDRVGEPRDILRFKKLDARSKALIQSAESFFIATYYAEDPADPTHGADVSHRGGKAGFVKTVDDAILVYPEFAGNNHFNTLGNLVKNPLAGLLFIDFDNGDMLYLACSAKIIWDSQDARDFDGAQRLVCFQVEEGLLIEAAMPLRWRFLEDSPSFDGLGSWDEVAAKRKARQQRAALRTFRVDRIEAESESVRSLYLVPEEGGVPLHEAGQFLPIQIKPAHADKAVLRTYSISNAPNGAYLRLSIKREPGGQNQPEGLVSNAFHREIKPGSTVRALSPRGKFTLAGVGLRPIVLMSAGVGITPMISMLQRLKKEATACGCDRKVWFLHGARNGQAHAFRDEVMALAREWPHLTVHFRYSRPLAGDRRGEDYHSEGRLEPNLLRSLLPFDDYEFFICGPAEMIRGLRDGLRSLNVGEDRIRYELFGKGPLRRETAPAIAETEPELPPRPPARVHFARSDVEAVWTPDRGTLLELAEAAGLRPDFSCRSGVCQTCAVRVLAGKPEYDEPPAAVPEGQALICSAYPRARDGEGPALTLDL